MSTPDWFQSFLNWLRKPSPTAVARLLALPLLRLAVAFEGGK